MAKFKAEFENNIPKYTLEFRGQEFSYSMVGAIFGTKSDKPTFSTQLANAFDDLNEEELSDDIDVDMLDCNIDDTDELFCILERLEDLE